MSGKGLKNIAITKNYSTTSISTPTEKCISDIKEFVNPLMAGGGGGGGGGCHPLQFFQFFSEMGRDFFVN